MVKQGASKRLGIEKMTMVDSWSRLEYDCFGKQVPSTIP